MSECSCNIALPPRLLRGVTRTVRVTVVDKNDNPVDLTVARNVVVTVSLDGAGRSEAYVPGISIQGDDNNVVEFAWYADVQRRCGRYTIDVNADFGNRNQSRVDFHREFGVELVEHSCDVSEEPAEAMEVDDGLDLEGTLEVTTDGMSAFDQWRTSPESEGYPPTEEGFFAWMRQPATDAAADVEAGEAARNAAEAQRVAAEQAREAQAASDHSRAASDHTTAASDHTLAASDHVTAGQDHTQAVSDHDTAAADHTTAGSDHTKAVTDHTTAASDHTTAGQDHAQARQDHTTAGTDHTRAESDHSRAESDHTRAEQDHEAMQNVVPTPSPSDEGKVLTVTDDDGTLGWEDPAGGDVDQTYDPTSQNAQSGVAMAGALSGKQDKISDLDDIRDGAAAGATAYQKPQYGIPESDLAGEVKDKLKETRYISSLPTSDITSTDDLNDVISRNTLLKLAEGEASALIYNQLTEYGMSESDYAQTECVITKASAIVGDRNNKCELTFVLNGYEYAITADYNTRVATVTVTAVEDVTDKADKVSGATNGHLAALDSNGNLTDSGKSASDLTVEANPTVPSGTTPTALTGLKIGNGYYSAPSVVALTNNEIDTIWTNAS